jgi:seryl-tRNA synthetase
MLGLATFSPPSAGRGFVLWRGEGPRLVRALVRLMLDVHTRDFAYEEVRCPSLATPEALAGSAHLPALAEKMYAVDAGGTEMFLAPRLVALVDFQHDVVWRYAEGQD